MSKRRATFGKLQRERDKQAKAATKRERRAARSEEQPERAAARQSEEEQGRVLTALAALHEAYEDGRMGVEEFEAQRDELRSRLQIQ